MASKRAIYLKEHEAEQTELATKRLKSVNNESKQKNNLTHKQMNATGYFSQPNVKEYQKEIISHIFGKDAPKKKGRGTFFENEDEFREWALKYFELCINLEVVPTISGLCTYMNINRDTLYGHASNPNSMFYTVCRQAIDYCHFTLESGASESKINNVAYIFQAKNYFDMKDTQEVRVQAHTNQELNSPETLKALQEQKEKEVAKTPLEIDIREATFEEKV